MFIPPNILAQQSQAVPVKENCGCGGDCCKDENSLLAEGTFLDGVKDGLATGIGATLVAALAYYLFRKQF